MRPGLCRNTANYCLSVKLLSAPGKGQGRVPQGEPAPALPGRKSPHFIQKQQEQPDVSAGLEIRPLAGLRSLRSRRPLPTFPASLLRKNMSPSGPIPLSLSGGGQARRRPVSIPAEGWSCKLFRFAGAGDRVIAGGANLKACSDERPRCVGAEKGLV